MRVMIIYMKHLLIIITCIQFLLSPVPAFAQVGNAFLEQFNISQGSGPADYVVKRFPNQKLIPVRLIGGVNRPGFYQIPEDTSLLTLMAYSGGASLQADVEDVTIMKPAQNVSTKFNVRDLMDSTEYKDPILTANDIVYIRDKKQWFSNNAVTTLAVVSTTLAIVLSSYLIRDRAQGKY